MMWNALNEMERLTRELDNLFYQNKGAKTRQGEFPAVNVFTGTEHALLTCELPGIDPNELDITAKNNVVTISGRRTNRDLGEGKRYLKKERGVGEFKRSFSMGFRVAVDKIDAKYKNGILEIRLPRDEADKPKKIDVLMG